MLPTEKQLQQEFKVGRATIRSAMQVLQKEGCVTIQQGRGTRVIGASGFHRFENIISVSDTTDGVSLLSYDIELIKYRNLDDLEFLGISQNDPVYRIRRLLGKENTVYTYMVNYIPYVVAPDIDRVLSDKNAHYSAIDIYTLLNSYYGVRYTASTETLFGSIANEEISTAMKIDIGTPLICTRRTAMSGVYPMECSYTFYNASTYQLVFKMERNYTK